MAHRIRRDDEVVVIGGKDRGKTGRVLRVDPKREKVFVEGMNIVKRHQRARPGVAEAGGVVSKEGPIHLSNVALIDPKDNKPTRIASTVQDGRRLRVSRRSGEKV